jgi:hypothetical protein
MHYVNILLIKINKLVLESSYTQTIYACRYIVSKKRADKLSKWETYDLGF